MRPSPIISVKITSTGGKRRERGGRGEGERRERGEREEGERRERGGGGGGGGGGGRRRRRRKNTHLLDLASICYK